MKLHLSLLATLMISKGVLGSASSQYDEYLAYYCDAYNRDNDVMSESLYAESSNGNLNTVKTLLQNGADVNHRNKNGETALYIAASNGHVEVVKFLCRANGIDVNKASNNGYTPLDTAVQKKYSGVVMELLFSDKIEIDENINIDQDSLKKIIGILKKPDDSINKGTIRKRGQALLFLVSKKGYLDLHEDLLPFLSALK